MRDSEVRQLREHPAEEGLVRFQMCSGDDSPEVGRQEAQLDLAELSLPLELFYSEVPLPKAWHFGLGSVGGVDDPAESSGLADTLANCLSIVWQEMGDRAECLILDQSRLLATHARTARRSRGFLGAKVVRIARYLRAVDCYLVEVVMVQTAVVVGAAKPVD